MTKNTNPVELQDIELDEANGGLTPNICQRGDVKRKAPNGPHMASSGNKIVLEDDGIT